MKRYHYTGGILANLASQGRGCWTIEYPEREQILLSMVKTISTWDLNLDKNINYRFLRPILNLLSVSHTPESQLWAAWTLANLTTAYGGPGG